MSILFLTTSSCQFTNTIFSRFNVAWGIEIKLNLAIIDDAFTLKQRCLELEALINRQYQYIKGKSIT